MQITLEIEEPIYNSLVEMYKPFGLTIELVLQRLLTGFVILAATKPDVLDELSSGAAGIPAYCELMQRVLKPASRIVLDEEEKE